MPAYAIVQVDVNDADEYAKYAVLAGPAVAKYGGEFLARGGEVEVMEGTTRARCVIIDSLTWTQPRRSITVLNTKKLWPLLCQCQNVITNLLKAFELIQHRRRVRIP